MEAGDKGEDDGVLFRLLGVVGVIMLRLPRWLPLLLLLGEATEAGLLAKEDDMEKRDDDALVCWLSIDADAESLGETWLEGDAAAWIMDDSVEHTVGRV